MGVKDINTAVFLFIKYCFRLEALQNICTPRVSEHTFGAFCEIKMVRFWDYSWNPFFYNRQYV